MSDWFLEDVRQWFLDNPIEDEALKKCSKFIGKIPSYPVMKGEDHPMYGKKHSEETKKKMRSSKIGLKKGPLSEEHKDKLRKPRPHAKKNISNGLSMNWIVTEIKTGKEFRIKNLQQFCRDNNLAAGNLYKTVTGECKQHKGYSIRHD